MVPQLIARMDAGTIELADGIGLSSISEQLSRTVLDQGFILNILVVGKRKSGASTLINSLFSAPLIDKKRPNTISTCVNEIVEHDVRLRISVTTYHNHNYDEIVKYIETRYKDYHGKELGSAHKIDDRRVHACLYIVPPEGICKTEMEGILKISKICNFIPVITKADIYTREELEFHKYEAWNEMSRNHVSIFGFEDLGEGSGANEHAARPTEEKQCFEYPFCTIASEQVYDVQGCLVKGRRYPWGFVDISDESYCDFKKLQRLLVYEKTLDLIEDTHEKYYKDYVEKHSDPENPEDSKKRTQKVIEQIGRLLEEKHEKTIESLKKEERMLDAKLSSDESCLTGEEFEFYNESSPKDDEDKGDGIDKNDRGSSNSTNKTGNDGQGTKREKD